ncbi:hypothetical protein [uncultured Gemmiger sp.]|uniref:hypothetical protein n=1 Tax=uncultured Gemmiger sp. TaxID=1623490 RepID=UPI0025D8CE55|nr:hypothetical protein [uncultured Gemmiger sp.]
MAKVKVVLNRSGVRALLKSEEMKTACAEEALAIRARCGTGYATDTYTGKTRVNAMVWTDTAEAKRDNAENNTLLKALK